MMRGRVDGTDGIVHSERYLHRFGRFMGFTVVIAAKTDVGTSRHV